MNSPLQIEDAIVTELRALRAEIKTRSRIRLAAVVVLGAAAVAGGLAFTKWSRTEQRFNACLSISFVSFENGLPPVCKEFESEIYGSA